MQEQSLPEGQAKCKASSVLKTLRDKRLSHMHVMHVKSSGSVYLHVQRQH